MRGAYKVAAGLAAFAAVLGTAITATAATPTRVMDDSYFQVEVPGTCTGKAKHVEDPINQAGEMFSTRETLYCGSYVVMLISSGWAGTWDKKDIAKILKRDLGKLLRQEKATAVYSHFFGSFPLSISDGTRLKLPAMLDMGAIKKEGLVVSDLAIIQYNPDAVEAGFCLHGVSILFQPSKLAVAEAISSSVVLDNDRPCRFRASR